MAQSVEHANLGLSSGHDLRVMRLNSGVESAGPFLSPPSVLLRARSLSLS